MAVVLSSGGNLGAAQVGMLRALVEAGVVPDLVVGCSVGALNGAAFAEDPTLVGVDRLERLWGGLDGRGIMPYRRPRALAAARRRPSICPIEGLRGVIEQALRARSFEELGLPFECVATDPLGCAPVWFGTGGGLVDRVLASAALPGWYPPVEIEGRPYVDGGVLDDVPFQRAVDRGAQTVYVLEVGSFSRPWTPPTRPLEAYRASTDVARALRWQRSLAAVPPEVALHVVPHGIPDDQPPPVYDDFSLTGDLIEGGYNAAQRYLSDVSDRDLPSQPTGVGGARS